ncbi:hypothetical protein VSS74_23630 [Conexibacter stalactiti]|uniref:Uncharacterized protein n=1 Tax=Conexibacter stalactiti TaxID=1940611 RepID=A0ABU4HWY2_9ACTN|nr:hypothetical protein [Conexibacter stalactiti]MDW5597359.1 hypothetical protein [Conexibacter stalactiti]MEC5038001.1 hypothetical protein [Conexibacter stalactiti]
MRAIPTVLVTAVVLLAGAATGAADTVRIEAPAEVVVDQPTTITLAVETTHADGRLIVERRPAADGDCNPVGFDDPTQVEQVNLTYMPIAVAASGIFTVSDRVTTPGDYRICAWLQQGVIGTYAAAAGAVVHARPVDGSIRIDRIRQAGVDELGTYLLADVSGTANGPTRLFAEAVGAHRACSREAGGGPRRVLHFLAPRGGDGAAVGPGRFRVRFRSAARAGHGRYRICVAMREALASPRATARAVRLYRTKLAS